MSERERLSADELRTLFLFGELTDDQLSWLAAARPRRRVPGRRHDPRRGRTGVVLPRPAVGDAVAVQASTGRRLELRRDHRGAYTGAFNFYVTNQSVPQVYSATARAVEDCRLFELPAAELGRAVRAWYPMAAHLLERLHPGNGQPRRDRAP